MTEKKPAVNSTAKNETPVVKNETGKTPPPAGAPLASDQKPELSNLVVSSKTERATGTQPEKRVWSLEERLVKLDELNDLVEKRDAIVDALRKVKNFYISSAGACSLKFFDSKNETFSISHPLVIAEMVAMAAAKLEAEQKAIEAKIDFHF